MASTHCVDSLGVGLAVGVINPRGRFPGNSIPIISALKPQCAWIKDGAALYIHDNNENYSGLALRLPLRKRMITLFIMLSIYRGLGARVSEGPTGPGRADL